MSRDLRRLSAKQWGPVHEHEQSRYVEGLCEQCGGPIANGEKHLTRAWLHGPAELCAHIVCAPRDVTLHGLNPGSDVLRVLGAVDPLDLPYEIERFKRDWRKRGYPFASVEVEG